VLDEADELVRNNNIGAVSALARWAAKLKHRPALVAVSATPSHGLATFLQDHARPKTLRTVNLLEATPRARVGLAAALRSQQRQSAAASAAAAGAESGADDDEDEEGDEGSDTDMNGSGRKRGAAAPAGTGGKAAAAAMRAAASASPLAGAAGRGSAAAPGRGEGEGSSDDAAARPLFISRDSWREGSGLDAEAISRIHTGLGLRSDGRDVSVGLGDGDGAADAASASDSYYLSRASLGLAMPPTLHHLLLPVPSAGEAYPTLTRWLAAAKPQAVLSFHNSVESLEAAEVFLRGRGVQARVLGSAYDVRERHRSIADVSSGKAQVLLATEMGARGLDIPRLSHVLNFDAPSGPREYVHRAGRVGRLSSLTPGRRGTVVTMPVGASQYAQMLRMLRGDLQLSTAPVDAQRGPSRGWGGSHSGAASNAADAALSGADAVILRANAAAPDSGDAAESSATKAAQQSADAPIAAAAAAAPAAAAFAPLMRADCVHGELRLSLIPASSGGKASGGGSRSGSSDRVAGGPKRSDDRNAAADKPAARRSGALTRTRTAGE
jgi:hypothetical protein